VSNLFGVFRSDRRLQSYSAGYARNVAVATCCRIFRWNHIAVKDACAMLEVRRLGVIGVRA